MFPARAAKCSRSFRTRRIWNADPGVFAVSHSHAAADHECAGTLIDYELKLFGIRFHWQTLIEQFEPEAHFVDVQLTGPYRRWHHEHAFEEAPGGTCVIDRVDYEMPLGPLGRIGECAVRAAIAAADL